MNPTTNGLRILVVDDSPSDAFLVKEALKKSSKVGEIHTARDGVEAIEFLHRQGQFANAPRPDLILLDLNMPRKDGREVLTEIKNSDRFRCIPVIVLTSSSADSDITRAYQLHANCYLTKPADFTDFKNVIAALETFWFTAVTLPVRE
jgi:two-component system, chemotaxis family, response regulator Rcp1